jgi:ABC-2 type transport system ATP-binding protein
MTTALQATALGKRYRGRWALQDCSLSLPAGRVTGLIGPNGAGKTTLIQLAAGLLVPSSGRLTVLGEPPRKPATIARVSFVAQDKPLYPGFTVQEMLRFGGWLNPRFDHGRAESRLTRLGIPMRQRVGKLSGGQRAQVALALALGKRPDLLLLDEPVANLDPLARHEFLQVLMAAVAETGLTVLLSSHLLADLERSCDFLVLLSASRVQLTGETDRLLGEHLVLTGPRAHAWQIAAAHGVVHASYTDRQAILLIRAGGPVHDPAWTVRPAGLEEIVIGYMTNPQGGGTPTLTLAEPARQAAG